MKALVYLGPGSKRIEERPKPEIKAPGDTIVKISKTTICGTDLHILKGDVATCVPGRILGHEGTGVIDSVGAGVTAFRPGDRVLISCISSCGKCEYCRRGMYLHLHDRRLAGDPRTLLRWLGDTGIKPFRRTYTTRSLSDPFHGSQVDSRANS